MQNLQFPNGTPIIPPGHIVYLSTDDPKGICENCYVNRQPCTNYKKGEEPPGCPPDVSILYTVNRTSGAGPNLCHVVCMYIGIGMTVELFVEL
jgi:hypothetical protein